MVAIKRKSKLFKFVSATLFVAAFGFFSRNLPAGFAPEDLVTSIEIDGVDFGRFDHIGGLDTLQVLPEAETPLQDAAHATIVLHRDFVTDPSLYLWAKNAAANRIGQRDVHIVRRTQEGSEVSRQVMKNCHPLSWTVESVGTGNGGFHETVELAVRHLDFTEN